jgi:6-phosphogluconolactonase/glucosamine-6-phosphate isomerase/deaminase
MMSVTSTFKFHNKHQVIVSANVQQQQELVKQYMHSIIGQTDSNKPVIIGFSGGSMPPFLAPLLAELPNDVCK